MLKTSAMIVLVLSLATMVSAEAPVVGNAGITPPQPVGGIQAISDVAEYPKLAIETKFERSVVLRFRVDRTGNISNIIVVSSGGNSFDESAISAVKSVEWIPATINDRNVDINYELPFKFCCRNVVL